ncbi:unnamed protein product [Rotaria sordida]|uniref:Uncharacterized protein n=1 Tax=Rotaria sordida TaxID=392033 RepID=A0A814I0L8_9BILA|nr:unnamed protein product [Rotaria sordida]CAF1017558.1 unnamed protein product [Rotaria sordida]CAF1097832.1 unnamed protein product [Rotaria sordida]CAF1297828.1 unnamed protein product [Rotaria sordida]CAF3736513.1 unnamed protein product [Rotaria sordida]
MRNTRSSILATPSSQTNNQSKLTRLYNESLANIEKSFSFNPEKIFSTRINRWLNHQFDVHLLDQGALSWYLLGTTAHLCSGVFVHRNNREPIPNNLYSFLVCGSG